MFDIQHIEELHRNLIDYQGCFGSIGHEKELSSKSEVYPDMWFSWALRL